MTDPERTLEQLVGDLERLEGVAAGWDDAQRGTLTALRTTIEAIQAEAFRRMIRVIKEDPGGFEALKASAEDPWVRNVLTYHGILRAPAEPPPPTLESRVEAALESVRPMLAGHEGNVELVAVEGSVVKVRLVGSCDGCAFSDATLQQGIETAIKAAVPEIETVQAVASAGPKLVQVRRTQPDASPFDRPWVDAIALNDVPHGSVTAVELDSGSVLFTRLADGTVRAYPNACTHLGMPLDNGEVAGGVLTCRYHGFTYQLSSGECLTAPDVALRRLPTRIEGGRVEVQPDGGRQA